MLKNIEPRFLGKLRLPNRRRSFKVNNKSQFVSPVFLENSKPKRFWGFLRVRVFHKTKFALDIKGGSFKPWSLKVYTGSRFPFVSFTNRSGRARICFMLFGSKVKLDDQLTFSLTDSHANGSKTFEIGDLRAVKMPQAGSTGYASREQYDALLSKIKSAAADGPISVEEYCEFQAKRAALRFPAIAANDVRRLSAILDGAILRNHITARTNFSHAVAEYQWLGQADQAAAVESEVYSVTKPYLLGPHGYRLPLSEIAVDTALTELRGVIDALGEFGAPACIASGTLLGLVRDGRLLPHDDDMDLNIVVKGASLPEVLTNWKALMERILDEMPAYRKDGFLALELPCGIEVDLFPAWVLDGKAFAYPYMFGTRDAGEYYPFATRAWEGINLPVPADVESILKANYGTWRKPDPYWKFDWTSAHRNFAAFLDGFRK